MTVFFTLFDLEILSSQFQVPRVCDANADANVG